MLTDACGHTQLNSPLQKILEISALSKLSLDLILTEILAQQLGDNLAQQVRFDVWCN